MAAEGVTRTVEKTASGVVVTATAANPPNSSRSSRLTPLRWRRRRETRLGLPLLIQWLGAWIFPGARMVDLNMHPVARAAWVGLLATALNLLPVGQLDGGHIVYSWLGERHRWVSLAVIVMLGLMGFLFWPWFFWAGILLLVGRRHFPVV